jgi:hypothetical protein
MVVPCDFVRQRPDIRRAERLIAARCADIGVAEADLLPRFLVGGNFGLQSQNLSSLVSSDSVTYNLGPSFSWPLLAGGRIWCNIDRVDAVLEEAIAVYEQTVLRGVEEVENAIMLHQKEVERRDKLAETAAASERALESVLKTYRAGKTDFNNVLQTQRTLTLVQNDLAGSEGQVVLYLITLYRALGGGWDEYHHCEERQLRVQCPERGDARAVENINAGSVADRYFEIPKEADQNQDKDDKDRTDASERDQRRPNQQSGAEKTDEPSILRDAENALELPTPKKSSPNAEDLEDDQLLDSLLQKKVGELEQRLQRTPSNK